MTAYKCRGYSAEQKAWVTGYAFEHEAPLYAVDKDGNPFSGVWYIVQTGDNTPALNREIIFVEVERQSIGVYSEYHDMGGLAVYEGDILKSEKSVISGEKVRDEYLYLVTREGGCFWAHNGEDAQLLIACNRNMQIVGNIHDNTDIAIAAGLSAE